MIIGEALRELFKDLTVSYEYENQNVTEDVQFHHGSQIELNRWINFQNENGYDKYPLIWYVRDKYTESNGVKEVYARLILFMKTEPFWLNDTRTYETYTKVLDPLFEQVKDVLLSNPNVTVLGNLNKKFDILDEPNYGVGLDISKKNSGSDFNSTTRKGEQGIAIEPLDAKIVDFHIRINTNCIIKNNC